jgi:hypothetical protein
MLEFGLEELATSAGTKAAGGLFSYSGKKIASLLGCEFRKAEGISTVTTQLTDEKKKLILHLSSIYVELSMDMPKSPRGDYSLLAKSMALGFAIGNVAEMSFSFFGMPSIVAKSAAKGVRAIATGKNGDKIKSDMIDGVVDSATSSFGVSSLVETCAGAAATTATAAFVGPGFTAVAAGFVVGKIAQGLTKGVARKVVSSTITSPRGNENSIQPQNNFLPSYCSDNPSRVCASKSSRRRSRRRKNNR